MHFLIVEREFLMLLKAKYFQKNNQDKRILNFDHSKLKILTSKQILQRLPIALAQVKAGRKSQKNCLFIVSTKIIY